MRNIATFLLFLIIDLNSVAFGEVAEFRPKHVGVISLLDSDAQLVATAQVIDEMERTVSADDWAIDSFVAGLIKQVLHSELQIESETISMSSALKDNVFSVLPDLPYWEIGSLDKVKYEEKLAKLVSFARSQNMDGLLLVLPREAKLYKGPYFNAGYGVAYVPHRYYLNTPQITFFYAAIYLVDVENQGLFNVEKVNFYSSRMDMKKVLSNEDREQIKKEFDRKYEDSEDEDLDWILEDMMDPPHHTIKTFESIKPSDRKIFEAKIKDSIKGNLRTSILELFNKKITPSWIEED